jgi:hypothetical protein
LSQVFDGQLICVGKQAGVRGAALFAGLELSRGDEVFLPRRVMERA